MAKGKVKPLTGKGYGFISCPELGKDIFYYEPNLTGELAIRKLRENDMVEFDIETKPGINKKTGQNEMKSYAVNIKLVNSDSASQDDDSSMGEDEDMGMAA
jgi:cold shock CspA family protein